MYECNVLTIPNEHLQANISIDIKLYLVHLVEIHWVKDYLLLETDNAMMGVF
jgi:hypothetical protein